MSLFFSRFTFLFLQFTFISVICQAQESESDYFRDIIDSYRKQMSDDEAVADTLEAIGKKYRMLMKYDSAIAYFNSSLMIREEIGSPNINRSYLYLGTIAGLREEYEISIEKFRKAIDLSKGRDSLSLSHAYTSIGLSYADLGMLDSALKYQLLALEVKNKINATPGSYLLSLNNLGHTFYKLGKPDSAAYYFGRVVEHPEAKNDLLLYTYALNNLGYWNYQNKRYDSSLLYYRQALEIAERDSLVDVMDDLYSNLTSLYIDLKDDTARYFFNKYGAHRDRKFSLESNRLVQEYRAKYDLEKKESTLARQQLQLERQEARTRLFVIAGGTIILLLSGLLAFLFYRQKLHEQLRKKDKDIHNQKVNELIRNQEISVLSARVEGQDMERQRIAEDLHDQLGSKLAAVKLYYDAAEEGQNGNSIDKARQLLNETISETRRIAHNLSSGVLTKFGLVTAIRNLQETLESSNQVEIEFVAHNLENHEMCKDLEINFYRIIQELISNILKHAKASHITIQLNRHADGLITLMVEDNGKGFNPQNVSIDSMGLMNLKNRVERFEGTLTIDSEVGHGTTVIVEIHENQNQAA